jgi:hypothetical protein
VREPIQFVFEIDYQYYLLHCGCRLGKLTTSTASYGNETMSVIMTRDELILSNYSGWLMKPTKVAIGMHFWKGVCNLGILDELSAFQE